MSDCVRLGQAVRFNLTGSELVRLAIRTLDNSSPEHHMLLDDQGFNNGKTSPFLRLRVDMTLKT